MSELFNRAFLHGQTFGDLGKSTFTMGLAEVADSLEIPTAKYVLDTTGLVFQKIYGEKDKKGEVLLEQDPDIGVKAINIADASEKRGLVNLLANETPTKLIDGRAGLMDMLKDVMGDIPTLMETFIEYDHLPVLQLVVKDVKSLEGVDVLAQTLEEVETPYQIILIKNLAMSGEHNSSARQALIEAWEKSRSVKFFKARQNTRELVFDYNCRLTTEGQKLLLSYKLGEVVKWKKSDTRVDLFEMTKLKAFHRELVEKFTPILLESREQAYTA